MKISTSNSKCLPPNQTALANIISSIPMIASFMAISSLGMFGIITPVTNEETSLIKPKIHTLVYCQSIGLTWCVQQVHSGMLRNLRDKTRIEQDQLVLFESKNNAPESFQEQNVSLQAERQPWYLCLSNGGSLKSRCP